MSELPYRPAVGVMLVNADGKVWVGQRIDSTVDAWQMPQGGLDPGEEPLAGALRELEEETGVSRDRVEVVTEAARELFYDLPVELVGKLWGGRWRGQRRYGRGSSPAAARGRSCRNNSRARSRRYR